MSETNTNNNFLVPIAIIIAGALVAWGLLSDSPAPTTEEGTTTQETVLAPVSSDDHFLGDPNAEVVIITYSDLECPYCKNFNTTLERIMDEYGKNGDVALVFRHFPIDQLHPKARQEAIATECAAELGGNAKFWEYLSIIFERTPSNNGFDLNELPNIAEEIGIDKDEFVACLGDEEMANRVKEQQATGVEAGVQGTPQSFIVTENGEDTINGGQPYDVVKLMIDAALEN